MSVHANSVGFKHNFYAFETKTAYKRRGRCAPRKCAPAERHGNTPRSSREHFRASPKDERGVERTTLPRVQGHVAPASPPLLSFLLFLHFHLLPVSTSKEHPQDAKRAGQSGYATVASALAMLAFSGWWPVR